MRRIAAILVMGMAVLVAVAQAPPGTPKFDVASVKPCAPADGAGPSVPGQRGGGGGGGTVSTSPGRLLVNCMSVSSMINIYLISDPEHLTNDTSPLLDEEHNRRRVRGGPAWVYSDRYTINAETSDRAAADAEPRVQSQLQGPMLRLLLEARFQLKTHRDTEQVDMYSLTIAKGGLKIKPMDEGGCVPFDPSTGRRPWEVFKSGEKPLCSQGMGSAESDWNIYGAGQAMSNLAEMITQVTGRRVFDKTGVSFRFNYNLRFAHDDTTAGDGVLPRFRQSDVPAGASVFTVLEEQLGLKLVPAKGPRGYLVIDSIQRPSEN